MYRRYLKLEPTHSEEFIAYLKIQALWEEAAKVGCVQGWRGGSAHVPCAAAAAAPLARRLPPASPPTPRPALLPRTALLQRLAGVVNDEGFRSLEGKSKHQLWLELCDLVTKHPNDVKVGGPQALQGLWAYSWRPAWLSRKAMGGPRGSPLSLVLGAPTRRPSCAHPCCRLTLQEMKVDAILRSGIRRFTDEVMTHRKGPGQAQPLLPWHGCMVAAAPRAARPAALPLPLQPPRSHPTPPTHTRCPPLLLPPGGPPVDLPGRLLHPARPV